MNVWLHICIYIYSGCVATCDAKWDVSRVGGAASRLPAAGLARRPLALLAGECCAHVDTHASPAMSLMYTTGSAEAPLRG